MKMILLVEDNLSIIKGLTYTLSKNNYEVVSTISVSETLKVLESNSFDLIIIDISLPDGNGFDLYKIIKEKYNTPSIFLTAKDLEEDIVYGFNLGIDDYITKPFLTGELLARISKIIRKNTNKYIKVGNIKLDLDKMIVLKDNKEIILTTLEYKILLLLMTNLNKVITRDIIINKIFELTGNDVYDNTVSVYIKRIREKLDTDIIKTIKGVGYRVDEK
ncbi:MAG: response regulator transcription factor [Bacilli bacterium]|nr:response regulator transcription factor [Bacilli bacterium]